jgi:hypothetical protein
VKTAHVHQATCDLAHWLTRHGSPTIYRCFALPQLLYRWRDQPGILWIIPHVISNLLYLTYKLSTLFTKPSSMLLPFILTHAVFPWRRPTAACLLRPWIRIPPKHGCLLCVLCVFSYRSLRRADHSSRKILPTVARRYV